MKRGSLFFLIVVLRISSVNAQQYDENFVTYSVTNFQGDNIGVIDMSRDQNHVKVKYFAAKDFDGTVVSERYKQWSKNKKIIAYSSGTYMDNYNPQIAKPIGLCVDNGQLVSNTFEANQFDGLAVVYATGGIVVSNLKDKNFTIKNADNTNTTLDISKPFERSRFIDWAQNNEATVFQTHLFYYKDKLLLSADKSKPTPQPRRFLAVGYDEDNILHHYIINIKHDYGIYTGTQKAVEFLKKAKDVKSLTFLVNLDTGAQDVFQCFKKDGSIDYRDIFRGDKPIETACNLVVYYYE